MTRRILIGRPFHESHGFNPRTTGGDCLTVLRGTALRESLRESGTALGGIARRLVDQGHLGAAGLLRRRGDR